MIVSIKQYLLIVITLLMLPLGSALATTMVYFDKNGVTDTERLFENGSHKGFVGEFEFHVDWDGDGVDDFDSPGYCVDLYNIIALGTYVYDAVITDIGDQNVKYQKAAWLMDRHTGISSSKNASLQLAIWKTLYDDDFTVTNWGSASQTMYESYIDSLADFQLTDISSTYKYAALTFHYENGSFLDIQDVIIRSPVPEPATLLLLGMGLLGIGAVGRKKIHNH